MIILLADNEPLLFDTTAELLDYIEPVDVENSEYEAFDETGRRLELSVSYNSDPSSVSLWKSIPQVKIARPSADGSASLEREALRSRLAAFVAAHGGVHAEPNASLERLIEECRRLGC